jgi:hypothetical protein
MRVSFFYFIWLFFALANPGIASDIEVIWELEDLDNPESVLYDDQHKVIFLSNADGVPNIKDGKGYISVISLSGEIIHKHWLSGLDAPKGLGRHEKYLYVSDIDSLIKINILNGRIVARYHAPEAEFLNDVIVNTNGDVYVSDMFGNKIYRLHNGVFSIWLQHEKLNGPNGLYIRDDHLIVGTWGKITEGFNTDLPGHMISISLANKEINSIGAGTPIGNLDGVEPDGKGNYYVTDWLDSGLYFISSDGNAEKILALPQGAADHDVLLSHEMILIPKMLENKLTAYRMK